MNEDIKTVVANELKQRLPEMFPGLTKQAYEEIINETIASLPKNEEKFEKAMEKAAVSFKAIRRIPSAFEYTDLFDREARDVVKTLSSMAKTDDDIAHAAFQRTNAQAQLAHSKDQLAHSQAQDLERNRQFGLSHDQKERQMAAQALEADKKHGEFNLSYEQKERHFGATSEANKAKQELAQKVHNLNEEKHRFEMESNKPLNTVGSNFWRGAGAALGGAAVAAMAGGALLGLRGALSKATTNAMRPSFEQSLKIAMSGSDPASEILREKKDKVRAFAETIFNFAPHVASDPNLLKGVLAHVVQGESIDPQTIRSLMELEEKRKNIKTFKPSEISFK